METEKKISSILLLSIALLIAIAAPCTAAGEDSDITTKTGVASGYSVEYWEDNTNIGSNMGWFLNASWGGGINLFYNATKKMRPVYMDWIMIQIVSRPAYPNANIPFTVQDTLTCKDGTLVVFNLTYQIFKLDSIGGAHTGMNVSVHFEPSYINDAWIASDSGQHILTLDWGTQQYYESVSSRANATGFHEPMDLAPVSSSIAGYLQFDNVYQSSIGSSVRASLQKSYGMGYTITESGNNKIIAHTHDPATYTDYTARFKVYNPAGDLFYTTAYFNADGTTTVFNAPNVRIDAEFLSGQNVTIWDDTTSSIVLDSFHIVVKDTSSGALLQNPSINIRELSTGAQWNYTPADGVQQSDQLMPGLMYNISATKAGYWSDYTVMPLTEGCYFPTCYGNNVDLYLAPQTTPSDPNQTIAGFRIYYQDTAYLGDIPVQGALIRITNATHGTISGVTNAQGYYEATVNKTEYYTYSVQKSGYLTAAGSFAISTPTPFYIRLHLSAPTPSVTTLPPVTSPPPTTINASMVNWRKDPEAREAAVWGGLSIWYAGIGIVSLLAFLALVSNLTEMIFPKRGKAK